MMKHVVLTLSLCNLSLYAIADCNFGDEVIPIGDSISVIDSIYERIARENFHNEGLSETEIERRLRYIWTE